METNKAVAAATLVSETVLDNGAVVSISKGAITVDKVEASQYQKNKTLTATLRQIFKNVFTYPEAQVSNNMQDNLFKAEDFGFDMKSIERDENRVAFIDVPMNSTVESIAALLTKNATACLYKVLSNQPILTDNQKRAIESVDIPLTLDDVANSQVVRYPENAKDKEGNSIANDLILDKNGKVQYRAVFFKTTPTADIDNRNADPSDFYASPEISAEVLTALNAPSQLIP